jgi:alkylation response protein AidB-like acyl-CoA dehydrogenase
MQDGAARLLQLHLAKDNLESTQRRVLQNAFDRLTSRDPARAWTSGQWMTERSGGSDVSQTETVATFAPFPNNEAAPLADLEDGIPLGPWLINGFKWFSSATDASMTILLARTKPDKGLSAFFAPMRRYNPSLVSATGKQGGTELNGVNIQRLKNKLGTQSLPTAELELKGMRGWMIGEEGKGIQQVSTILAITRVHSAISSLGYLGRGLAIARSYALVREVGVGRGKRIPLWKNPLHMRTLANITGEYHAMMLLTFYTIYILGLDETGGRTGSSTPSSSPLASSALSPPREHVAPLLRVLTSLLKSYCCERAVPLLFGCMAALGGVGYLVNTETEHANVARIFRDACVLPIWEGTTDVLASDTLRALKHPTSGAQCVDALSWFVESALGEIPAGAAGGRTVGEEWKKIRAKILGRDQETLLVEARDITFRIAEILIATLLLADVKLNSGPEVQSMTRRFLQKQGFMNSGEASEGLDIDQAIVYGRGATDVQKGGPKL